MPEISEILSMEYNLDTAELLNQMEVVGLANDVQGAVLANIILERFGRRQRRFSYSQPVDPETDGCTAEYERTLEHGDWVNGEDMVDADEFNDRFHRIETDLDAAARDAATALNCLMDLRAQLAVALEEIKGQINTLHADVFELKDRPWYPMPTPLPWPNPVNPPLGVAPLPGTPNPGIVPGFDGLGTITPDWEYVRPWMAGTYGNIGFDGGITPAIGGQGPLVNPGNVGVWALRGNSDIGTIGGMPATRLSNAEFNGDSVEVWSTPAGMFLTPITKMEDAEAGYIDPRVELGGRFNSWVAENADRISETFGNDSFTAADLEDKFGSQSIGSGLRVIEALKGFSGGTKFNSPQNLADRFSERQAERIIASGASVAVKIGAMGVVAGDAQGEGPKIETFSAIPPKARNVLAERGIGTLNALGETSAKEVAVVLERAGVPTSVSEISNWQGMARVVSGLS